MMKRILIGLGVFVVLLGLWVINLLYVTGAWRSIEPHFAGSCEMVPGIVGPEDLTIHPKSGIAYISSSDRRAQAQNAHIPGAIWAYNFTDPNASPVNLTPDTDIGFQPHGVSLWLGEDGQDLLFVLNHPAPKSGKPTHTVEVFSIKDEGLEHLRSLSSPELMVMPNDIVAVGPNSFYFTNTHANPPGAAQAAETYLRLSRAKVVYYDGKKFSAALEGMRFPNGINVTENGQRLWVASTTSNAVREYKRNTTDGSLEFLREIQLNSGPDNIEVDSAGNLWIGSHPKLLAVTALIRDPMAISPAQVLRVTPETGSVEEIYLSEGKPLSGASVASTYRGRMLIGQIVNDGVLNCSLP